MLFFIIIMKENSRWAKKLLDMDSYHGTVPMQPPISNRFLAHRELIK
jgi:hypothetical protein